MVQLRPYQKDAMLWLLGRKYGALFADPGTGKTLTILSLLRRLRLATNWRRVLIIAPLRVMYYVWPEEITKWGFDYSYTILHGNKKDAAITEDTDIHLVNPRGLKWFCEKNKNKYDILVLDESQLFRNPTSVRMELMRRLVPTFKRRYILTGTPEPKSVENLWSQMYILDQGQTLGTRVTHFRNAYFYHQVKNNVHYYHPIPGMDKVVWGRVNPLCYRIDAETNLSLPPLIVNDIKVGLPKSAQKVYDDMERELFAEINGAERFAPTSGAKYGICRQIAGGALYRENSRQYDTMHKAKLLALDELIAELNGKPLLVVFNFRHELERMQAHFNQHCPAIYGASNEKTVKQILEAWNKGKLPLLLAQAQSISHGLNMQSGGNDIAWYTLTDDYDIYEQLNRRIYRSGVEGTVRIHRIIAKGTIDQMVLSMLSKKQSGQQGLFDALQEYQQSKRIIA